MPAFGQSRSSIQLRGRIRDNAQTHSVIERDGRNGVVLYGHNAMTRHSLLQSVNRGNGCARGNRCGSVLRIRSIIAGAGGLVRSGLLALGGIARGSAARSGIIRGRFASTCRGIIRSRGVIAASSTRISRGSATAAIRALRAARLLRRCARHKVQLFRQRSGSRREQLKRHGEGKVHGEYALYRSHQ